MITVSASSIKDYLVCEAKIKYKFELPRDAILATTKEMAMGKLIHFVLEKEWRDKDKGLLLVYDLLETYGLLDTDYNEIAHYLNVFHTNFVQLCSEKDKIEYKFKIAFREDTYVVGKMDRIIGDNSSIIDWKTSRYPPYTINDDIQFLIYYWAYKELFGRYPANVYYGALIDGSLKTLKPNINYLETIFNEIIPRMVKDIKTGNYTHDGLFKYNVCKKCQYLLYCARKKDVVASRKLYN